MAHRQYGTEHRKRSEQLRADAVGKVCRLCGETIRPGQLVDAGHPEGRARVEDPTSVADAVEHALKADCSAGGNRSAGGKLGNRRAQFRPSESW